MPSSQESSMKGRDRCHESELRTMVHGITKWRQFTGSKSVTIEPDHATLSRISKQKHVTPRLGYWLEKILDCNAEVVYKRGRQNTAGDAISRGPDLMSALRRGNQESKERKEGLKGEWGKCNKAFGMVGSIELTLRVASHGRQPSCSHWYALYKVPLPSVCLGWRSTELTSGAEFGLP